MDILFHQNILPASILMVVGGAMLYVAHSIRGGNVEILAGYDASRVSDKAGLAAWAGGNLRLLGFLQMAAGLLALNSVYAGVGAFSLATLILVVRLIMGSRRFEL